MNQSIDFLSDSLFPSTSSLPPYSEQTSSTTAIVDPRLPLQTISTPSAPILSSAPSTMNSSPTSLKEMQEMLPLSSTPSSPSSSAQLQVEQTRLQLIRHEIELLSKEIQLDRQSIYLEKQSLSLEKDQLTFNKQILHSREKDLDQREFSIIERELVLDDINSNSTKTCPIIPPNNININETSSTGNTLYPVVPTTTTTLPNSLLQYPCSSTQSKNSFPSTANFDLDVFDHNEQSYLTYALAHPNPANQQWVPGLLPKQTQQPQQQPLSQQPLPVQQPFQQTHLQQQHTQQQHIQQQHIQHQQPPQQQHIQQQNIKQQQPSPFSEMKTSLLSAAPNDGYTGSPQFTQPSLTSYRPQQGPQFQQKQPGQQILQQSQQSQQSQHRGPLTVQQAPQSQQSQQSLHTSPVMVQPAILPPEHSPIWPREIVFIKGEDTFTVPVYNFDLVTQKTTFLPPYVAVRGQGCPWLHCVGLTGMKLSSLINCTDLVAGKGVVYLK